eukprot:5717376-Amphidinium_carterae.1
MLHLAFTEPLPKCFTALENSCHRSWQMNAFAASSMNSFILVGGMLPAFSSVSLTIAWFALGAAAPHANPRVLMAIGLGTQDTPDASYSWHCQRTTSATRHEV